VDSQELIDTHLNKKVLDKIKSYLLDFPDQEACGLVISRGCELSHLPCENLSSSPVDSFEIDAKKIIENNVIYIYHSHVNCSAYPSSIDKRYSDELCIPFLIYSIRDDEFKIYKNISV